MYAVFKVPLPVTEVSLLFMEGHNLFPQAWQMLKINILNADLYRQPLLKKQREHITAVFCKQNRIIPS